MKVHDPRAHVRIAVLDGDAGELVRLLDAEWPEHTLQWIGDGLLAALTSQTAGSVDQARRCALALRDRECAGDSELADALEARLGTGPWPMLRPLPVDLEELSMVLEGDPSLGGGRIDLASGEVWPEAPGGDADDWGDLDSEDYLERWLPVWCEGSRAGFRDMESFVGMVGDSRVMSRLERALVGRGPFRRFKDVLSGFPDLLDSWHALSDERTRGRARAWLADQGYTPSNGPPRP